MVEDARVLPPRAGALRGARALGVSAAAAAAALVPLPPEIVERWYSRGLYSRLQPAITSASNALPVALIDVALVAAAVWWLGAAAIDVQRRVRLGWVRIAGRLALRTIEAAAILYLAFLLLWGMNYRRVPLTAALQYDEAAVSPDAAVALAATAVDRVNALYDRAHAERDVGSAIAPALAASFARLQRQIGLPYAARPGRPKQTIVDLYFRRAGVEGMTDPYFLETLVASDLLPIERPCTVAHEWAHLAGYANEGEANFLGWLTAIGGGDVDQYSGWLFLTGELLRIVRAPDRAALVARLGPGPTADRRAIVDRVRRNISPRVSAVGWQVYDRYLKANRVEAGAASYAEVVRLALGVRFGPDWTPIVR